MALNSAAGSSRHRRPNSAIRSFPPLRGSAASSAALPTTSCSVSTEQNPPPTNPVNIQQEPTSCGPESDSLSCRGNIKRPIVFAIRSFPKGCGPLATAVPKPSRSKEASTVAVRKITEKGSGLDKNMKDVVVGRYGEKDAQNPNRKSSHIPDVVERNRRFSRSESSESQSEVKEMEDKLNDVVRRITEEVIGPGKILENDVAGRSLGEKDGEKSIRKNTTGFVDVGRRFGKAESLEFKKKSNNIVGRTPEGRTGSGKKVENAIVGRSLGVKDVKNPNKKRPLIPDLIEGSRRQSGQQLDLRHERLIVQALMAAKRCPWMQNKRKGSIGLQSTQRKPRVRENGNLAKK